MDICLEMFNCLPAEKAIAIRKQNFLNKFCVSNNELCKIFTDRAIALCLKTYTGQVYKPI